MKVEQILKKESLDEMLHRRSKDQGKECIGQGQCIIMTHYLDVPLDVPSFFSQQSQNQNIFPLIAFSMDRSEPSQEGSTKSSRLPPKKPSIFHNFQKHLMTTLRSQIKVRKLSHSDRSKSNIAGELWEYIAQCRRVTRAFLMELLLGPPATDGQAPANESEDYDKMLQEFDEYSQAQLAAAQAFLCREVVRQGKRIIEKGGFEKRRLAHAQEFQQYFKKFIEELQMGKAGKRMVVASKLLQGTATTHIQ